MQLVNANNLNEILNEQKMYVDAKLNGSNSDSFNINQIKQIIISVYAVRRSKGSSYIPTPAPYNNANCGLINIQNSDEKCFYWCMKYHQSSKIKHMDRITVLSKLDKCDYNYENVNFERSYRAKSVAWGLKRSQVRTLK